MTAAAPADLAAFYADQHDRIFATLVLLVRDRSVAEELAQETFVRVCERWHRVRELDRPGAWAHRGAVNLALSKPRRRQAEKRALAGGSPPSCRRRIGYRLRPTGPVAGRQPVARFAARRPPARRRALSPVARRHRRCPPLPDPPAFRT